ncbi:hypothetical protein NKR23_g9480 [Pleurostoma richardsiae]|uniref:Uncharacterized protein n=1 Tax=Pleurostoma richardsiae TaxID=41990 RepID=A0AA38R6S5_9PEZI|nr:hypothetical protein NKR23_g9480 [Pleurostoma richardsiae]
MVLLRKVVASALSAVLWHLAPARAQDRPNTTTPCDFYAEKIGGNNTAANQKLAMALVLHSALLGPYSKYNSVPVPDFTGALVPTTFKGEYVDLRGYFNGGFASTNTGGDHGESVSFWDDGGIAVALQTEPGNGNPNANQDRFYNHVYSYFGTFLGCSDIGSTELPAYAGKASMYEVHKYMDLNAAEMGFFIDQATRGLLSIGFTSADAQFVNTTLDKTFNKRCAPAAPVVPADAGPQLQAICVAADCALSPNDTCSAYETAVAPAVANATLIGNYTKGSNGSTSVNASATTSSTGSVPSVTGSSGTEKTAVGWLLELGFTAAGVILLASGLL